jgi:hypothetical protein
LSHILLFLLFGALASLSIGACHSKYPLPPLEQDVYVWQRKWTPEVTHAVERASHAFRRLYVYAGDLIVDGDSVVFDAIDVDWRALAASSCVIVPVFRANRQLAHVLDRGDASGALTACLGAYDGFRSRAHGNGVSVGTLQIDFDCPSEFLSAYKQWLDVLRTALPETTLSMTALPSWLASRDFAPLVQCVDFYVLQVHGLERPASIKDDVVLCDTGKVMKYVEQAASFSRPFYVALPTYAYQAFYTSEGEFAGLVAEGDSVTPKPGAQTRNLSANPKELAPLVVAWKAHRPRNMRGIFWFRLPVEGDERNWPWHVLQAVMAGEQPTTGFRVEVRTVRQDLRELWVQSTGAYRPACNLRVETHWTNARIRAYDSVSGFRAESDARGASMVLSGPAPQGEQPVLAAWWVAEPEESLQPMSFAAGNVELVK